jgi:hypothetical protein
MGSPIEMDGPVIQQKADKILEIIKEQERDEAIARAISGSIFSLVENKPKSERRIPKPISRLGNDVMRIFFNKPPKIPDLIDSYSTHEPGLFLVPSEKADVAPIEQDEVGEV